MCTASADSKACDSAGALVVPSVNRTSEKKVKLSGARIGMNLSQAVFQRQTRRSSRLADAVGRNPRQFVWGSSSMRQPGK
jgi:hypothetical protein